MSRPGTVYLVGAGPGDPGLLTARAIELIAVADVILYDRLIPPGALDGANPSAELVFVGKQGGGDAVPQEQIEQLMVARAREGGVIVRLKGGDPFVFGRGGEEARTLKDAGIRFEIVPGVTAGVAAPAYAGIAVTHRDHASAVALVTGHEAEQSLDYAALAAFPGTLVFYMGVRQLPRLTAELLAAGRDRDEPATVIERGTLPGQRSVDGTLADIAERAAQASIHAPAVTLVGAVAAAALPWREPGPLDGFAVAVTRARPQASELAARLRALDATVIEAPTIEIKPLHPPLPELERFDLLCLTSVNGVELLFEAIHDARALAGLTIAAIGPGTAAALAAHGIAADIVPERSIAEALIEALEDVPVRRALIARARDARDVLPDALRERGTEVELLNLYETVAAPLPEGLLEALREADYITFTSASTVRFFLAAAGPPAARIVSIGPVTSAALREHGLEPQVEAEQHDLDGLVAALVADAQRR